MAIYFVLFIIVFIFGLCIGSFINVLITRLPKGKNIALGGSKCDHCGHKLGPIELIPLLSYFIQGGKCKHCKKPISEMNSFVELATGTLFVIVLLRFIVQIDPYSTSSIVENLLISMGVGLVLSIFVFFAAYDILYYEVPDKYSLPLILFFVAANFVVLFVSKLSGVELALNGDIRIDPIANILSGLVASAFIAILVILTKGKGMGGGDIRIVALIGLLAGFRGTVSALYLAFVVGALSGLIIAIVKRRFKGVKIPFVPFLSFGAVLGILFGREIFFLIFPLL